MAFSFNWAGLNIPGMNPIKSEVDMNQVGKDLGTGVRGWKDRKASEEYADLIDEYMANEADADAADDQEIAQIQEEIARLEQENAQLQHVVDVKNTPAPEQNPEPLPSNMVYNWAASFDPNKADREQIIQMQNLIGTKGDGIWGPKSKAAYQNYMNSIGLSSYGPNM